MHTYKKMLSICYIKSFKTKSPDFYLGIELFIFKTIWIKVDCPISVRKIYNSIGWLMLLFISISITFSTLHSHHHLELDHTDSHVNTGHCLVDDTNTCPVCGFLFNADVAGQQNQIKTEKPGGFVAIFSESQLKDPFTGQRTGRSPPANG